MNTNVHSETTPVPGPSTNHTPAWGPMMRERFFWGLPNTDTDTNAIEAAVQGRAHDMAAGKYAAANFANEALDGVTKRSATLLQANVLFLMVVMWLLQRAGSEQIALYAQFNRAAFGLALVGCVLLLSNLRLVWGRQASQAYGDPHGAFVFAMKIYKGRAWRYTLAHVLSMTAFVLTLISVAPFR